MSTPNSAVSELMTLTLANASKTVADNVSSNNALLRNIKTVEADGGYELREAIEFTENSNTSSYAGFEQLATGATETTTTAQFPWAQYASTIAISGRDLLMNSGKQKLIDLVSSKVDNATHSLKNKLNRDSYGDGTGNNGKNLTGLAAAIPLGNTAGSYAGISRSNAFWQNQKFQASVDGAGIATTATIGQYWTKLFQQCVRGSDKPDLIIAELGLYTLYVNSLTANQRFTSAASAGAGFEEVFFMGTPVYMEPTSSGIQANTAYFINSNYMRLRPMAGCNFDDLGDKESVNQHATVKMLGWMGNLTARGMKYHGVFSNT